MFAADAIRCTLKNGQATDPFFTNVVSLIHFDGSFNDVTGKVWSGNAAIDSVYKKFGSGSLLCSGSQSISDGASADWAFGTGDFTVEVFISASQIPTGFYYSPIGNWSPSNGWCFFLQPGGALSWHGNSMNMVSGAGVIAAAQFYYVGYKRESGVGYLYVNGIPVATGPDSENYSRTDSPRIGGNLTSTDWWRGNVDEVRVTKGVARDLSVVPVSPFPNS